MQISEATSFRWVLTVVMCTKNIQADAEEVLDAVLNE